MNSKQKFENFLESLKKNDNKALIESVKKGFQVCFEAKNWEDISEEEWGRVDELLDQRKDAELEKTWDSYRGDPEEHILNQLAKEDQEIEARMEKIKDKDMEFDNLLYKLYKKPNLDKWRDTE